MSFPAQRLVDLGAHELEGFVEFSNPEGALDLLLYIAHSTPKHKNKMQIHLEDFFFPKQLF